MQLQSLKNKLIGATIAFGLILSCGIIFDSTAQAQSCYRNPYRQNQRYRQYRYYPPQPQRYAFNNYEQQRGYSDGFNRGQEDARDRRTFDPNNSSHYRSGNSEYREGFRRGYNSGYRQYLSYRRY